MALINCPECGKEISDKALSCPNCGAPIASSKEEQNDSGEIVCCPRCGSSNLHVNNQGFSAGKAAVGAIAVGPLGLLAGQIGSKNVKLKCMSCGHDFTFEERIVKNNTFVLTDELKKAYIEGGPDGLLFYYMRNNKASEEEARQYLSPILTNGERFLTAEERCSYQNHQLKNEFLGCVGWGIFAAVALAFLCWVMSL